MAVGLGRPLVNTEEEVEAPEVSPPINKPPAFPITTILPRRASVREMIDSPNTLAGIESIYHHAQPSFSPMQRNNSQRWPEILTSISPEGAVGNEQHGATTRDSEGNMHAKGSIPSNAIALIHTHPFGQEQMPGPDDEATATRIQRPNYAMSENALWVAEPGNKNPRKVADLSYKNGHLKYGWLPVPIPEPGK